MKIALHDRPIRPAPATRAARCTALLAVLALGGAAAPAWALYKVVNPDGTVTYTDRAPVDPQARTESVSTAGSVVGGTVLPYALRQLVQRYPVTLYTGDNCAPCTAGRSLLTERGVPFIERTVTTPEDAQALKRLERVDSLPLLRIGGQQITGFSASDWHGYLDAAGYPRQSILPASFKQPPGTPLAPKPSNPTPAPAPTTPTPRSPSAGAPPTGTAPSGFRF